MPVELDEFRALDLWRRTTLSGVRELAALMNISKPAVTRAVDRLSELELVQRKTDENDRRSVLIQRTLKGRAFLTEFAGQVIVAGRQVA
ncbi:MAG: MarR family transcriptional regulator [Proteobacteria bacterium]|nr:MarR family transcriptional regulator [Pseudomonadota bacterium]